jgi:tRNA/tmRNA/rRNA uracil-C5-methylase (TrmA/RlmC/RlmD family)
LNPNDSIELHPEKPVVGGRMLARSGGEIVLVSGTITGERVRARLERRQQGVWFAETTDVLEASPDRRSAGPDPKCGGMTLAHITYARQLELKVAIVTDAFARIARLPSTPPVPVTPSPIEGYRMRYRVHADGGRLGFFREGTHQVCDPAGSGQLNAASLACLAGLTHRLPHDAGASVEAFEFGENLSNTERVVNLALRQGVRPSSHLLAGIAATDGITGVSWTTPRPVRVTAAAGRPWVSDPVAALVDASSSRASDRGSTPTIRRHAPAFFQANRFLTPVLAKRVLSVAGNGPLIDLYAGVGLFAICLAGARTVRIDAIESDAISGQDLEVNAAPFDDHLKVHRCTVEAFFQRGHIDPQSTMIIDPPRTGISRAAMQGVTAAAASRLVYVSCDVATLARDTRRLVDTSYDVTHLEALDLFPNTAHVEAIAVFDRR